LAVKREPQFLDYVGHIWNIIEQEATKMGMATVAQVEPQGGAS
jgi:hypothetical protein